MDMTIAMKRLFPILAALALSAAGALAQTADPSQRRFATPEAAIQALKDATARADEAALRGLFGAEGDRIKSADPLQLRENIARVNKAIGEYAHLSPSGPNHLVLMIGFEAWPFPIPLVREGGQWRFDTAAGAEEIVNRRIGANELRAIVALEAYVAAQRDYASKPRGDGPVRAFAQKIRSSPGKKDGLYWPVKPGEEESPFGPLVPDAAQRRPGAPYYGYYYKILTAQGPAAPGGAYSYIINRNMVAGFAMLAYPAAYGNTGIMSFIVNHYGDVYQKDLGPDTAAAAAQIRSYNPDSSWTEVDPPR
jgi:hypothetical protein